MKYLIYCRKSSEAEDRQVLSIDSQEAELERLAERDNIKISKVFREAMSAKAPGRPIFEEMLKYLEKDAGSILLVWKLDRLARNALDGGKISWLVDRGIISEIRTPEKVFHNLSDDKFMMALDFGIAKKYVDDLSVNVKRGNRAKLERGQWPNHAPFGYINNRLDKSVTVDKKNRHYIKRIFELYATGSYGLKEVSNILYAEGLRTRSGLKILAGNIHRIIKRTFYYGVMERDGKFYPGNHEPLISKALYDQANQVLEGKLHPQSKGKFFHLRGFLKCANCTCMLTATKKKGHDYYYCTNGKGICVEHKKYMRSEYLDKLVSESFKKLEINADLVELAYLAAKEQGQNDSRYLELSREKLVKELDSIRKKQNKLLDSYLAELVPEDVYRAKTEALNKQKVSIEMEISKNNGMEPEGDSTLELVKNVFLKANTAQKEYLDGTDEEKRILVSELLWNLSISNQKVQDLQFKSVYALIAKEPKPTTFFSQLGDRDSNPD